MALTIDTRLVRGEGVRIRGRPGVRMRMRLRPRWAQVEGAGKDEGRGEGEAPSQGGLRRKGGGECEGAISHGQVVARVIKAITPIQAELSS